MAGIVNNTSETDIATRIRRLEKHILSGNTPETFEHKTDLKGIPSDGTGSDPTFGVVSALALLVGSEESIRVTPTDDESGLEFVNEDTGETRATLDMNAGDFSLDGTFIGSLDGGVDVRGNRITDGEKPVYDTDVGLVETGAVRDGSESGLVADRLPESFDRYPRDKVYFAADDGYLYAVNTADGTLAWSYLMSSNSARSSPCESGGTIYVGSNDNNLYALNSADGTEKWVFSTTGSVQSPLVVNGTVYAATSGAVHAVDATDGTEKWNYDSGGFNRTPSIYDGKLYFVAQDEQLHVVNTDDGSLEWTRQLGDNNGITPAISNGIIYISKMSYYSPTLLALDAYDGSVIWEFEFTDWGSAKVYTASVHDGSVYVGHHQSVYHSFDAESGDLEWKYNVGQLREGKPAIYDGTVYFSDFDGYLYAVNAEDGSEEWRFTAGGGYIRSQPAVIDGTVYLGGSDNAVYAVDAAAGTQVWSNAAPGDSIHTEMYGGFGLTPTQHQNRAGRFDQPGRF